jgi:hypothetical protein
MPTSTPAPTSREKFEKHIKTLKTNDASTRFDVKEVTVYPGQNKVFVKGVMNNFVGSKSINSRNEAYEVEFKISRGRLFLKDIKLVEEVSEK